jgi:hypothetical protein
VKVERQMRLDARCNDLPDPQYFGVNVASIKTGKLNGQAIISPDADKYVSAGGICKSRHAAKKLNSLFIIAPVEDLGLVFNVQTFANLILDKGLQVGSSYRFKRFV